MKNLKKNVCLLKAMEKIWQNQNPPDCSKAKYMLSSSWFHDFGSEVHYLGVMLGIALESSM